MASSRKSPKNKDLPDRVFPILQRYLKRGDRIVVALSGGVDSVVLCDLLRRYCKRSRCELRALHINHQISPHAARWALFCRALCGAWEIPLKVIKVSVSRGDSLEAAARTARYRVFAAQRSEFIALAHHLDDQAETLLLQLLRGAGVKGLSAMPVLRKAAGAGRDGENHFRRFAPEILRPLLDVARSDIETYALRHQLKWIEDESNLDIYFDRNFLRYEVLPILARRYPSYRVTLARAGRNLAESAQLLDELAALDLGATKIGQGLPVTLLRTFNAARAKNVLRYYLRQCSVAAPSAARLEECVRQAWSARSDTRSVIDLGSHELRYFSGKLFVVAKYDKPPIDYQKTWRGETRLRLDELGGTLTLRRVRGRGISLARLHGNSLTVKLRRGGERFQPDAKRPRRNLKNLFQETQVPPWQRETLPLLYRGKSLVCVPGIGIDDAFKATREESGLVPSWKFD